MAGPARPRISAAAILRPDEPGLDGFFAQFPSWLCELAVVWDGPDASPQDLSAQAAPAHGLAPNVPLRQTVRPLDNDFAAQRNAMLGLCTGDWVFYLDGDERLVPEHWEVLRGLAGGAESGEVVGYHLPRLAFYPDMDHCMAGLGLWPDLQLRLFRRAPGLRFQGAAHERLEGLAGPTAALCALPILHYSHVRKDGGQWKRKLELYDRALGALGPHRGAPAQRGLPPSGDGLLRDPHGRLRTRRGPACGLGRSSGVRMERQKKGSTANSGNGESGFCV